MDEDGLNEIEIFLDRMIAAEQAVGHVDGAYLRGVVDGLRKVKGAVGRMREELA